MSSTDFLSDSQWVRILIFLRGCPHAHVGPENSCRQFIEAVIWMTNLGAPWRTLPKKYGRWNTVYKRFARWRNHGIWDSMYQHFADDPEIRNLILNSLTTQ
jgi:transposase